MAKRQFHWSTVNDCVMHETDGTGTTTVEYTHEPGPFGPLISEARGGTTYTHHYDALGSTTMLTDDTGAVTDTFQYDAWGNSVARTGMTPTPYTWVGRWGYQNDTATTGGYYIRERNYLPTIARWRSTDPLNAYYIMHALYTYVSNSPLLSIDASGLVIFKNNARFDTGIIIGKACGPTLDGIDRKVTWDLTPQEKKDKTPEYFSQLVTIEIQITTSCAPSAINCELDGGAGLTCCSNSYRYTVSFFEALRNEDQQPCNIDRKVWTHFLSKCPVDPCCDYSYHATTTKELTQQKELGNATDRFMLGTTPEDFTINPEAFIKCCKDKEEKPDAKPPIASGVRESGQPNIFLIHPHPYVFPLYVSEKEINVTSSKCKPSNASCVFTGYSLARTLK